MKTLKILRIFFRLKGEEFRDMKAHIWGLCFLISVCLVALLVKFDLLDYIVKYFVPFIWGAWVLYGLFLFARFLYRNWQKAKKEYNNK
jgi:hypothetical protein